MKYGICFNKICIRVFMPDLHLTQNLIIYYLVKKDFEISKGKLERVNRRRTYHNQKKRNDRKKQRGSHK